jgi:hypothetical protein
MEERRTTEEGYEAKEGSDCCEQEPGGPKNEIRTESLNRAHIVGTCPADADRYDDLRRSLKKPYGARPCKK